MNIDEAKRNVGKLVISRDPGYKMVRSIAPHGPYRLLKVTKGGLAILEGREEFDVPPSLISLYENNQLEEFEILEVRPKRDGKYFVTIFQYKLLKYYRKWLLFQNSRWKYDEDNSYVCFIHKRQDS